MEGFDPSALVTQDTNTPLTSHNVDLPLNTEYSCKNWCGPNSQCLITREQCTSDVDCQGCQPLNTNNPIVSSDDVPGDNDAGKLTWNQTPQYSPLTAGYGTGTTAYIINRNADVPLTYEGIDTWGPSYNAGVELLDDKLSWIYSKDPNKYKNLPQYPIETTTTGLFWGVGPTPANAYLS